MKKYISISIILIFFILFLIYIYLIYINKDIPKNLSATETVELYFNYWKDRNIKMMNKLVDPKLKTDKITYKDINLIELYEIKDENLWNEAWYQNPYDYTCINTTFKAVDTITKSELIYNWNFYLVKESPQSNWIIVMKGIG